MVVVALAAALVLAAPVGAQGPSSTSTPGSSTPTSGGPSTTTVPGGATSGTAVGGTLVADGQPVAGVRITVADASGKPVATVRTAADGAWKVPVPAVGRYTVTLDAASLPDGVTLRQAGGTSRGIEAQGGRTRFVLFGLTRAGGPGATTPPGGGSTSAATPRSERSLTDRLANAVVNGLLFGLIIAVTAIGLSLIFGTTGLVNFAHGELVTFGAVSAWFLNVKGVHIGGLDGPRLTLVLATVVAAALGGVIGAGLDRTVWRPLRGRRTGLFQMMVISIGLSIAARQALLIWFGSDSPKYRDYGLQRAWDIGPVSITPRNLAIMGISLMILVAVAAMLQRTRIGKAMRAVSDNPDLAASSGIDVQRVILFVWALGGALAATGGVLQGSATAVNYLLGFNLLLLMFAGVILGGLGSAYGAMFGSLVVGLATEVSSVFISTELKSVAALVVLIGVLLVRPEGILGRRERVA